MKQRLLSLCMALLGIAAGAQAQIAPMVYVGSQIISDGTYEAGDIPALVEGFVTYDGSQKLLTLNPENAPYDLNACIAKIHNGQAEEAVQRLYKHY